jgi:hypothetical protein
VNFSLRSIDCSGTIKRVVSPIAFCLPRGTWFS